MSGFRRYGRKPLKCAVKICHQDAGDIIAETIDVSETGVFIRSSDLMSSIAVGDKLDAQLFSDDNFVENTQLKVVRLASDGVGLAFE